MEDQRTAWDSIQAQVANQVRCLPLEPAGIQTVAGLDVQYSRHDNWAAAAAVVMQVDTLEVVEVSTAVVTVDVPYMPGYLAFRELPPLRAALDRLEHPPDALLCDRAGIAHPRRAGLACFLGVERGIPTLGVAKGHLIGSYDEPAPERGSRSRLLVAGDVVGDVVRTRMGVKPVFVSPGHLMTRDDAVALTLALSPPLPAPRAPAVRGSGGPSSRVAAGAPGRPSQDNSRLRILPVAVMGSSETISTMRGYL